MTVAKTENLEKLYSKAKKELEILHRYKVRLVGLMILSNAILAFWYMKNFWTEIQNDYFLLFPLFIVCILVSAGIDNLLSGYYSRIVEKQCLKISDDLQSVSCDEFMEEINKKIKEELSKMGRGQYEVWDMTITKDSYVFRIIMQDRCSYE